MDIILPASYTDYDFLTMKGKKMLKKLLLAALVLVGLSVNAAAEDKAKASLRRQPKARFR